MDDSGAESLETQDPHRASIDRKYGRLHRYCGKIVGIVKIF